MQPVPDSNGAEVSQVASTTPAAAEAAAVGSESEGTGHGAVLNHEPLPDPDVNQQSVQDVAGMQLSSAAEQTSDQDAQQTGSAEGPGPVAALNNEPLADANLSSTLAQEDAEVACFTDSKQTPAQDPSQTDWQDKPSSACNTPDPCDTRGLSHELNTANQKTDLKDALSYDSTPVLGSGTELFQDQDHQYHNDGANPQPDGCRNPDSMEGEGANSMAAGMEDVDKLHGESSTLQADDTCKLSEVDCNQGADPQIGSFGEQSKNENATEESAKTESHQSAEYNNSVCGVTQPQTNRKANESSEDAWHANISENSPTASQFTEPQPVCAASDEGLHKQQQGTTDDSANKNWWQSGDQWGTTGVDSSNTWRSNGDQPKEGPTNVSDIMEDASVNYEEQFHSFFNMETLQGYQDLLKADRAFENHDLKTKNKLQELSALYNQMEAFMQDLQGMEDDFQTTLRLCAKLESGCDNIVAAEPSPEETQCSQKAVEPESENPWEDMTAEEDPAFTRVKNVWGNDQAGTDTSKESNSWSGGHQGWQQDQQPEWHSGDQWRGHREWQQAQESEWNSGYQWRGASKYADTSATDSLAPAATTNPWENMTADEDPAYSAGGNKDSKSKESWDWWQSWDKEGEGKWSYKEQDDDQWGGRYKVDDGGRAGNQWAEQNTDQWGHSASHTSRWPSSTAWDQWTSTQATETAPTATSDWVCEASQGARGQHGKAGAPNLDPWADGLDPWAQRRRENAPSAPRTSMQTGWDQQRQAEPTGWSQTPSVQVAAPQVENGWGNELPRARKWQ